MPSGDRTGPLGSGPMTGRGLGICAGYGVPGYANNFIGFGRGRGGGFGRGLGMGGGRGWRHQYYATGLPGWARGCAPAYPPSAGYPDVTAEAELANLQKQAQYLKDTLREIEERLSELQKQTKND